MSKNPDWVRYLTYTPIKNFGAIKEGSYYFINVIGDICGVVKIVQINLTEGILKYEFASDGKQKIIGMNSIENDIVKIYDIVD